MNDLTKIASLPGSGGGCMSALPPEKNEAPMPMLEFGQALALMLGHVPPGAVVTDWTPVYYKADHDELAFPPIDLGEIGGDGA